MNFDFLGAIRAQAEHASACSVRPCKRCGVDRCPRCGNDMYDRGTTREIDGNFEILKLCEGCADSVVVGRAMDAVEAMLPAKYAWAKVGAPELRDRVKLDRKQFVEAHQAAIAGKSLVLHGGQGDGKTSASVAFFRAMLERGRRHDATKAEILRAKRAAFATSYDLSRDRARHKLGDGESPLVERVVRASVALIDDLGSEPESQLSAIADAIYQRHSEDRPTWITTWCSPADVAAKYGAGIARRVFDGAHIVEFGRVASDACPIT